MTRSFTLPIIFPIYGVSKNVMSDDELVSIIKNSDKLVPSVGGELALSFAEGLALNLAEDVVDELAKFLGPQAWAAISVLDDVALTLAQRALLTSNVLGRMSVLDALTEALMRTNSSHGIFKENIWSRITRKDVERISSEAKRLYESVRYSERSGMNTRLPRQIWYLRECLNDMQAYVTWGSYFNSNEL
jgi:hypothetical protein